jgi:hypothetical protein
VQQLHVRWQWNTWIQLWSRMLQIKKRFLYRQLYRLVNWAAEIARSACYSWGLVGTTRSVMPDSSSG